MIDLHSHTNESDGTYSPAELVDAALETGLEALAITDHDTFAGYDLAAPIAAERGLDLVCGVEVNSRMSHDENGNERRWDVHLLGYFLHEPPSAAFRGLADRVVGLAPAAQRYSRPQTPVHGHRHYVKRSGKARPHADRPGISRACWSTKDTPLAPMKPFGNISAKRRLGLCIATAHTLR